MSTRADLQALSDEDLKAKIKVLTSWAWRNPMLAGGHNISSMELQALRHERERRKRAKIPLKTFRVALSWGCVDAYLTISARSKRQARRLAEEQVRNLSFGQELVTNDPAKYPIGELTVRFRPNLILERDILEVPF